MNLIREFWEYAYHKKEAWLIAEHFMRSLVRKYGKHPVSTDGYWYPHDCKFLKLKHYHIHLPYEKSIVERTIQHVKDRTESFDDYFPCRKERGCKLEHISNWFMMFMIFITGSIIIPLLNEQPTKRIS